MSNKQTAFDGAEGLALLLKMFYNVCIETHRANGKTLEQSKKLAEEETNKLIQDTFANIKRIAVEKNN